MPTDTTEKGLEDLIVAAMTDAAAPWESAGGRALKGYRGEQVVG